MSSTGADTGADFRGRVVSRLLALQDGICAGLQALEREYAEREGGQAASFAEDPWSREGGGGGRSRVMSEGRLFEKAGVGFSEVHGELSERFASEIPGSGREFWACGVSLVIHPRSPFVPTVHANFRHIRHGERAWFGGGADLTPYYFDEADRDAFHAIWRAVCERHESVADYEAFSRWCDRYFWLSHRNERRGVGGIFFDDLLVDDGDPKTREATFAFVGEAGDAFLPAYAPIVRRNWSRVPDEGQREWHEIRRGRYVEFNLIHDRGTVFGLKTGGRTESILMSLPPRARWVYGFEPAEGTPEAELLAYVRRPPPPEGAPERTRGG